MREERYLKRLQTNVAQKSLIGEEAAQFIEDRDIIALDAGATTEHLAQNITGVHQIKIITHSMPIARILSERIREGFFTGSILFWGALLAESSKCGQETFYKVCDLSAVDHLITDAEQPLSAQMLQSIQGGLVKLHLAEPRNKTP